MSGRGFLQRQVASLVERPIRERLENKFPINKPLRERTLDDWLYKALFWTHVHPSLCLIHLNFLLFRLFHT